jgi:hypothetical protein
MKKSLLYILLIFSIVAAVVMGTLLFQKIDWHKEHETTSAQVLLEEVAKVFKMTAIEGYVSEIYDYKSYKYWDINFLRRKALVRVKAKVSIGYDIEKAKFIVDDQSRTIKIYNFPAPEILSIDHDLDYYNLEEGIFNSFGPDELSALNKKAKTHIETVILKSDLFSQAESQKEQLINLLNELFESSGWKVVVIEYSEKFVN